MPRTIRFHLDENCDKAIAKGLRRLGVDGTTTNDLGLTSASDDDQIVAATREGRTLVTQEQDFLVVHASGIPYLGIVYTQKGTRSIGQIIRK